MNRKLRVFIPIIIVSLVGLAMFLPNPADFLHFMVWWFCFAIIGILFLPITDLAFGKFRSGGYIFSKPLCLAAAGYLQWLLSTLRILPFRLWSCFLIILLLTAANLLVNRKTETWQRYIRDDELLQAAGGQEALFMALLIFWTYLRAIKPDIEGLEKFMDFGFLNSIMRSDWLPAPDMWLAGMDINYYYLGHFFTAFLTKLTLIDPAVTYNLMMATLFALSFMLTYSVAEFLIEIYQKNRAEQQFGPNIKRIRIIAGIVAGLAVCFAGNLHSMIFGVLFPQLNTRDSYWFPSATRYIGYNPEVPNDMTIHEFPLYSFVVSDLHAHVINLLFVLTVIGLSVSVADNILRVWQGGGIYPDSLNGEQENRRPVSSLLSIGACFLLIILLIGLFPAINFWDYPIYIVFTGALLLYVNLKKYSSSIKSILVTVAQVITIGAAAYTVVLPFQLSFDSMGAKIKLVETRSRLYQLGILWGWQLFFAATLICVMIWLYKQQYGATGNIEENSRNRNSDRSGNSMNKGAKPASFVPQTDENTRSSLLNFIKRVNPADAFVFIIFICAIGLFIIPEIIYIVDIYPNHPRANTMFKLGFQAFILFGIGSGYTLTRLIFETRILIKFRLPVILAGIILLTSALIYPFFAITQWYGNPFTGTYKGLDGTKYMLTSEKIYTCATGETVSINLVDDYALIQFINGNINGSPVLAEANGDSYTFNGRISSYTGIPNILNWYNHQLLWRNSDYDMLDERLKDIYALYKSGDAEHVRRIISKYNVEYIVVGEIERLNYPELDEELLASMGNIIFRSSQAYDTYLIQVVI